MTHHTPSSSTSLSRRMSRLKCTLAALCALYVLQPAPVMADDATLQCVPYARDISGIQIYGDAHSWWGQADGRYARGDRPAKGAVMAFKPHGAMQLGHVAAVSKVVDSRTVLLNHANWSTIDGTRGHIERDVMAIDVSDDNDWSAVRVWYTPIDGLGTTTYPIHGFIYPVKPGTEFAPPQQYAKAMPAPSRPVIQKAMAYREAPDYRQKPAKKSKKSRNDRFIYETATASAATASASAPSDNAYAKNDPIGHLIEQIGL